MDGFESLSPGRDCQAVGTARALGQPPEKIHGDVWNVVGNQGDSLCYIGVQGKVEAIQEELGRRVIEQDLPVRLIAPNYVGGVSDGQLNGTPRMRFSLIGREVTNEGLCMHLSGNDSKGTIAVVACDKPPVGTLAALLEHNEPAIIMSDGSIRPGEDPETGERIDIVTCYQAGGDEDQAKKNRLAMNACPGYGSCGGMFTYNTMQSFFGVLGMEPLHMISPASEDPRRVNDFPGELIDNLQTMAEKGIKPRDIVTPASLKNAITIAIAMGGSTNVLLHAPEIASAAGIDLWTEVMTQDELNQLSLDVPVVVNARPFGEYSMVDIDDSGGLQVIAKDLLDAGLLDGSCITCTGETLSEQIERLDPPSPDQRVIYSVKEPYMETGGLRLLKGNLAPHGGAAIKLAGVEGGMENGQFVGKARVFDGERDLLLALTKTPEVFKDKDMVVIRYEGPQGAPGMPEMLDPTSRISTLCKKKGITVALMTDARFSGGSVGLVLGHVTPEAFNGGPIALVEDGDTIVVDLNENSLNCVELDDDVEESIRRMRWQDEARGNGGVHPKAVDVENRLLKRMRATATTALQGAGMSY